MNIIKNAFTTATLRTILSKIVSIQNVVKDETGKIQHIEYKFPETSDGYFVLLETLSQKNMRHYFMNNVSFKEETFII